jgi:hypothetical protein
VNVKELHKILTEQLGDKYNGKYLTDPVVNTPDDERIGFVSPDGVRLDQRNLGSSTADVIVFAEPFASPVYELYVLGFSHIPNMSDENVQGMYVAVCRNEKPHFLPSALSLYVNIDWVKGFIASNRMNWYTYDGMHFDSFEAMNEHLQFKNRELDEQWQLANAAETAEYAKRFSNNSD